MPLQISYAGYQFHQQGVTQYGMTTEPEQADMPARLVERFKVKIRFFEESSADNEARWATLKTTMRANPRGTLTIADDSGHQIESRTVRFAGSDGDAEWGQYRREVTLTFEASGGTGIASGFSAAYTPAGGAAVVLPNVTFWGGNIKNDRFTTHTSMRREGMDSINATGSWAPDGTLSDADKRDALLAKKTLIQSIHNCPDGTLAYGAFSQAGFQVEDIQADIVGNSLLNWKLTAFRRVFPDGVFGQADYTVEPNDDIDTSKRGITVAGKIVAETEAHALTLAETIRSTYATGRVYAGGSTNKRVLEGVDGSDPCVELGFSFRYRETLSVTSWRLKVTSGVDARSGDTTSVYSGNVTALNSAAALAKAQLLGAGFASGSLMLLSRSEEVSTQQASTSAVEFISVDFVYTYLGKSDVVFAEVRFDNAEDYFGPNTTSISGNATAASKALAVAFARTFQLVGVLLVSVRESDGKLVNSTAGSEHFVNVEFSYVFGASVTHVTAGYGMQVTHDYTELTTQISFSGSAFGPNVASCDALIDAIVGGSYGAASRKLTDSRTKNIKRDETQGLECFLERPFSVVWTLPISAADAAAIDILEAAYTITKRYGFWRPVIDEIPYGVPWVQEAVTLTCGGITVNGTVKARNAATALAFARAKYLLLTGYLSAEPEESDGLQYWPMNDTTVKHHTLGFSYQSKDPALVWPL